MFLVCFGFLGLCPTDIYSLKIARHNDPMNAARSNEKKKTRSATIRPGSAASARPHTGHDTKDSRRSGRPLPGQTRTGRHDRLPAKVHDRSLHSRVGRGAHLPKDGGPSQDQPESDPEDGTAQDTLQEHHLARLWHDSRDLPAGSPHEDHRRRHGDRLVGRGQHRLLRQMNQISRVNSSSYMPVGHSQNRGKGLK